MCCNARLIIPRTYVFADKSVHSCILSYAILSALMTLFSWRIPTLFVIEIYAQLMQRSNLI